MMSPPSPRVARPPATRRRAPSDRRTFNVTIDPRIAKGLRAVGGRLHKDGNYGQLVAGLRMVIQEALVRRRGNKNPLPDVRPLVAAGRKVSRDRSRDDGRPYVGPKKRVRTQLYLAPDLYDALVMFGDGVVSDGIDRVAVYMGVVEL